MAVIIDGTTGVATPGVTDTGDLSVAGSTTLTTPLPVASGGTGASSLSGITVGSTTNLAGGSAGTIPYQSTVGTTAMLATGTNGQFLTSAGPSAAPTWSTLTVPSPAGGATVTNPMSSNVTLTSSSNRVQVLTPDAHTRRITLPDATTISAAGGPIFVLQNTVPWYPVAVMDSAGTNIGWVVADYESRVYLTSTASATGNWVIKTGNASADAGVYPFDALYVPNLVQNGGSYLAQNTVVTLSTDLAVAMTTGSNAQNVYQWSLTTQPNKSNYGLGGSSNSGATSAYAIGNIRLIRVSATMTMYLYYDYNNAQLICFVVSFDPVTGGQTKGSEVSVQGLAGTPYMNAATVDSTHVAIAYTANGSTYTTRMISISGTTCTVGSAVPINASTIGNYSQLVVLSSTLAHFTDGVKVWDITLNSGANSVTVNSSVTVTGSDAVGLAVNSATSSIVFYRSSSLLVAKVVTSSGGTPTLGTQSGTLATGSSSSYYAVSTVKDGYALVLITANVTSTVGPRFALVSVSGGIPVLSYSGTFPGATTAYQLYLNFVSGLGVTSNQTSTVGSSSTGSSYVCQKIAIVGGI